MTVKYTTDLASSEWFCWFQIMNEGSVTNPLDNATASIYYFLNLYYVLRRKLIQTRQSAQWGTYTPDQRYRQFLKSTKYVHVALTLEMAVICFML